MAEKRMTYDRQFREGAYGSCMRREADRPSPRSRRPEDQIPGVPNDHVRTAGSQCVLVLPGKPPCDS